MNNKDELLPQISEPSYHNTHPHLQREDVIKRLARIEGHVRAIKHMVKEDTACPDVLVQIAAIKSALNDVGWFELEDH